MACAFTLTPARLASHATNNLSEAVAISTSSLSPNKLRSMLKLISSVIGVLPGSSPSLLMPYGLKMSAVLFFFWIATSLIFCALTGIVFDVYPCTSRGKPSASIPSRPCGMNENVELLK